MKTNKDYKSLAEEFIESKSEGECKKMVHRPGWGCADCPTKLPFDYQAIVKEAFQWLEEREEGFRVCMHNPPDDDSPCKEEHPWIKLQLNCMTAECPKGYLPHNIYTEGCVNYKKEPKKIEKLKLLGLDPDPMAQIIDTQNKINEIIDKLNNE